MSQPENHHRIGKLGLKRWEIALSTIGVLLFVGAFTLYAAGVNVREILFGADSESLQQPIGKVVAIRGQMKRETAGSLEFTGIRSTEKVYHRDTVVTDSLSAAVIHLDDGSVIELGPRTMVRLELPTHSVFGSLPAARIEVVSGQLNVKAVTRPVVVRSHGRELKIDKNNAEKIRVIASSRFGSAAPEVSAPMALSDPAVSAETGFVDDETHTLVQLPSSGEAPAALVPSHSPSPSISPTLSPSSSPSPAPSPSPSPTPRPTRSPQVPRPKFEPTPLNTPAAKPTVVAPAKPAPPYVEVPTPSEPREGAAFSMAVLRAKGTGVLLTWKKAAGAEGYIIEVSRAPSMSENELVTRSELPLNFYVFKPAEPGVYWWHVRSMNGANGEWNSKPCAAQRFEVKP